MIIKPMVRSSICINAHPAGCAKDTDNQIAYVKAQKTKRGIKSADEGGKGPKMVLVLGCSTGYGLASRISAAFEYGADTIGVSFEKEPTETKGGTPGWYNNMAFDRAAKKDGLISITVNADAYADETRAQIIADVKKTGHKFDLIIYSLASPVRTDPDTKVLYKSVIKPQGKTYSGKCIDIMTQTLKESSADPATDEEVANTVKVMGGEDWRRWIKQLSEADVLAQGCRTIAYSYIGPDQTHQIYRDGTIGMAKKDLEQTALDLDKVMKNSVGGAAYISVNKGLVTRSSAVIPVISLYISILFKVMKQKGTHEGCIEQMERLFAERLYTGPQNSADAVSTDKEHRIRIDDREMDPEVQKICTQRMETITQENLTTYCDLDGYKHDFLATNGFDIAGVDYDKDVARMDVID
jgi:enoyl-[acyl-carrier protein] reductase / trans-2-enoyl-CoA reductase (NAD+)